MGRTVKQIKAAMTPGDRAEVEARTAELIAEVEGLKAFRVLAERSQEQIAESLGIKQPSIELLPVRWTRGQATCACRSKSIGLR